MPFKIKKKLTLFLVLLFLAILLILLEYAPHYLTYADLPVKSDAIVLFVGADTRARQEEANVLITQGYARYFLIPAYGKIQDILGHDPISPEIGIVSPDVTAKCLAPPHRPREKIRRSSPRVHTRRQKYMPIML